MSSLKNHRGRWTLAGVLCAGMILLASSVLVAQQAAGLRGAVKDESGAVIPGVLVTATNEDTGIAREAVTNERGLYVFSVLSPGTYAVSAELSGFRKTTVTGFLLETATIKQMNFVMKIGQITDQITVTSDSVQQIQFETSDLGDIVFERKIKDLPLNGRRPIELVLLQPGMAGNPGQGNAGGFAASGGRRAYNAIYMDGIDMTSSELGTGSTVGGRPNIQIMTEVSPSVDAIEEFRVITGNPSAEYSRTSGFQVAMTTKSGTNEYHGSIYNFHRNTVLNANAFFNNASGIEREPLRRNQFGLTFGGPVKIPFLYNGENKTFFFYNYEGGRTGQFATVTRTVYTKEAREGIFRFITPGVTINPETGETISRNTGAILDPVTGAILPGVEGVKSINVVEGDFDGMGFDSTGTIKRILDLTPLPNDFSSLYNSGSSSSEGNDGLNLATFRFNATGNEDSNLHTVKLDHIITNRHTLSFRFNIGNVDRDKGDFVNNVFEPFPGIRNRARLENQLGGAVTVISSFSPTLTNEFRVGISRNKRTFTASENIAGAISINAPGQDPYRRDAGSGYPRQTFQLTDNMSWSKGSHAMRFGFTVQTTILNPSAGANAIYVDASPFNAGISVNLTALCPGAGSNCGVPSNDRNRARRLFNFLTGRLGEISAEFNAISESEFGPLGTGDLRGYRGRDWGWFFQDDWKVTPNLTLNLGLRYDYYQVPWEVNSLFVLGNNRSLIDTQVNPSMPDTPILFGRVGPAYDNQIFDDDFNNLSPVFGFSWDPFGSNKTAVRGSFRISYDHIFTRTLDNIDSSQPGMQYSSDLRGNDLINQLGLTNPQGQARGVRLSDLKVTPLHDGLGGTTGTSGGKIDLSALVDPRATQKPLSLIPNIRQSLAPDDFEKNIVNPYSQSWSLGIQHEIMDNTVAEIRYVGRKGIKQYTGVPGNQMRLPTGWLPAFRDVQGLLKMTRGEAYAQAGIPLGSVNPNSRVTLADLYGRASSSATSISQYTPGPLASLAPQALHNLFLATTDGFMDDVLEFITSVDLPSIIGEIDLAAGSSQVHRTSFLESAGLVPLPSNTGNMPLILGLRANAFRPSPQFLNGPDLFTNASSSNYHALQLQVNRRFHQGLQFQANYTFSKNTGLPFEEFATGNSFNNFFNLQVERSLADYDLTHDFKFNAIWELPYGHGRRWGATSSGWVNHLLGGWQLSSIVSIASDFPTNVSYGSMASTYQGGERPDFQEGVVVTNNLVQTGSVSRDENGRVVYFSQDDFAGVFQRPPLGRVGNTPRLWLRGPGYWNTDLAVMKHFEIKEDKQIQFRAEFFNLFNNVNFGNPNSNLESSQFGEISGQNGDPRIVQFALKFFF